MRSSGNTPSPRATSPREKPAGEGSEHKDGAGDAAATNDGAGAAVETTRKGEEPKKSSAKPRQQAQPASKGTAKPRS